MFEEYPRFGKWFNGFFIVIAIIILVATIFYFFYHQKLQEELKQLKAKEKQLEQEIENQ